MAATSASALSVESTISSGSKASPLSQSKTHAVNFNCRNNINGFTGLKSSLLGKISTAGLHNPFSQKFQNYSRTSPKPFQIQTSFKVAILGAAGGIGVAADLSHCNTPSQVRDFTGPDELADCLKGVDVVVIPAGIVKTLIEAVADNCPDAFIHVISNPVNSTVPIVAEVLRQKGVYDPKKLFGVTTLDVVRANTFVAQKKNLKLIDVDVPVVGGHAGITILPLLSKTKPSVKFTDQEVDDLTVRIQNGGTEVVEAKAGAGSATLSMAYAAARFLESSLRALDGDSDVYECSFVQSNVTDLGFFASRVKLGRQGVEAVIASDLEGLTEYEEKGLEALKVELKGSIDKGLSFAQKQTAPA
ncbi:hypothetical protein E3N88_42905 [Mikania micrantha]|uniref:Malate dehydrogenase n=1 Tax=Mikania micrantha TaxID=192012 RepID=A0A5N6LGG3_9ASTR|nr:hypothetical protein E3N88_42905 [Mikania micrantha]